MKLMFFKPNYCYIGLKTIPHFTTLHKVSCRLKGSLLEDIFLGFASKGKIRSGIDSTGLSFQHSTYYYEKRIEFEPDEDRFILKTKNPNDRKKFEKLIKRKKRKLY